MLEEATRDIALLARTLHPQTIAEERVLDILHRCLRDLNATAAQAARAQRAGRRVRLRPL